VSTNSFLPPIEAPPGPLERAARVALGTTQGVGIKIYSRLMEAFGNAEAALSALPSQLKNVRGVGQTLVERIKGINLPHTAAVVNNLHAFGIHFALHDEEAYPKPLHILADKPVVLFWQGAFPDWEKTVAVVGTRKPSPANAGLAFTWGASLASRGYAVISGLARGIDTAAHEGALHGGQTVAVLGSGVRVIYPPDNTKLADQIRQQGALISELFPTDQPSRENLVLRNRITVALSRAVIVVEAGEKSGALHAARMAYKLGKPVFAIPNSQGNLNLLEAFAKPLPQVAEALTSLLEAEEGG
jgi:DNA processing protein